MTAACSLRAELQTEAGTQRERRPQRAHGRAPYVVALIQQILRGGKDGQAVCERARGEGIEGEVGREAQEVLIVVELCAAGARLHADGQARWVCVARLK